MEGWQAKSELAGVWEEAVTALPRYLRWGTEECPWRQHSSELVFRPKFEYASSQILSSFPRGSVLNDGIVWGHRHEFRTLQHKSVRLTCSAPCRPFAVAAVCPFPSASRGSSLRGVSEHLWVSVPAAAGSLGCNRQDFLLNTCVNDSSSNNFLNPLKATVNLIYI